jgi:SOS-response transcriptional repressor LexA
MTRKGLGGMVATQRSQENRGRMGAVELGRLLANRRVELGMTQVEAGKAIGLSQVQVGNWERGLVKNVTVERLEDWARLYRMERRQLARVAGLPIADNVDAGTIVPSATNPSGGAIDHLSRAAAELHEAMRSQPFRVPVLDARQLARGRQAEPTGYVYLPPDYAGLRERLFAVEVEDDSMVPEIAVGDRAIVEQGRLPGVGSLVVCVAGDRVHVKRLVSVEGGFTAKGLNGQTVLIMDVRHIIGIVIGIVRMLV